MSIEKNKTVVRRILTDIISEGNYALADELIALDFLAHTLRPGQGQGLQGFKQGLLAVRSAFPDWRTVPGDMLGEGDLVAARWMVHGTHRGDFVGVPPTGRRISMSEMGIFRVSNGKLSEYWSIAEELSLLQQIGVLPQTALARPGTG